MTQPSEGRVYHRPPTAGNPVETTAWGLTELAIRLDKSRTAEKKVMLDAVRLNWRLWTIIQAEAMDPQCMIPEPIRGNLLSLAAFVDKHTVDMLAQGDPANLDVLININRQLAMGLHENMQARENGTLDAAPESSAAETLVSGVSTRA